MVSHGHYWWSGTIEQLPGFERELKVNRENFWPTHFTGATNFKNKGHNSNMCFTLEGHYSKDQQQNYCFGSFLGRLLPLFLAAAFLAAAFFAAAFFAAALAAAALAAAAFFAAAFLAAALLGSDLGLG